MESFIPTAIIIAFVSLVFWVIRSTKKQREAIRQIHFKLGFTEVLTPDQALLDRITAVARHRNERISVSKVYKRDEGSCVLYDCQIYSSREKNSGHRSSVLVVPEAHLPAFRLAPCMAETGLFSGLVRKATQLAMTQGDFSVVDTASMPDFSARYLLVAKDPGRIQAELPSQLWREIMALSDRFFLQARDDTIIFSVFDMAARRKGSSAGQEEERLSEVIKVASALGRIFKSTARDAVYA